MQLDIFKLRFKSPLHIGDERSEYDKSLRIIHSDTLYAALTACIAKVGGSHIAERGDLGFVVSSLFPFYQKDKDTDPIYFLPKSKSVQLPNKGQLDIAKKIKKVQWLDFGYFQKQINGEKLFDAATEENIKGNYLTSKSNQEFDKDFMYSELQNRVVVPRYGVEGHEPDARPFYMERIRFKNQWSGMYFLATGKKLDLLKNALEVLQYEGIGTDRTIGNGYFSFEKAKTPLSFELPESDKMMNLSLFCPKKEQVKQLIDGEKPAFEILRRGGWITTPGLNTYRKNVIYMFAEGSIFNTSIARNRIEVEGELHDLKPVLPNTEINHPIWRSGRSIMIPVKIR